MTLAPLLQALPTTTPPEQLRLIERAYAVADHWHRDHERASGDPYITHPVAVAVSLAENGMDHQVLCAALLHDVLDDTDCTEDLLVDDFGARITGLIKAMAAIDSQQALAACTDPHVLMLKLCDRLHNLRTIRFLSPDKQRRKSRETLEIFAPLAHRLGADNIGVELAELARPVLRAPTAETGRRSLRLLAASTVLLPKDDRARWLQEWHSELRALSDHAARRRFTAQLLVGMPRMAVALRWQATGLPTMATGALLGALRWIIGSDLRVWSLLTPLITWMTFAADNPADAIALAITVPPVLATGVSTLRAKLHQDRPGH